MVRLYVSPTPIQINVGDEFTININVEDVADLIAYRMVLCWNPSVLECIEKTAGDLFPSSPFQPANSPNNAEGWLVAYATNISPVSGSGTIMKVKFKAIGEGESPISFCTVNMLQTILLSSSALPIDFTAEGGQVSVTSPPPATSTLRGAVTDASTGLPIDSALVELNGYTTLTALGIYSLTVPPAIYTLTVTKEGYEPHSQVVDMSTPDNYIKNVSLTPVAPPTPPSSTLTGTVTDASTGLPIESAQVELNGYITLTDSQGRYSLTVPPSIYTLTVKKEGYEPYSQVVDMSTPDAYTKDVALTPIQAPPSPTHILSVDSVPSGVRFKLYRGDQAIGEYFTPFSQELEEDTYTIEYPLVHVDPATNYEYHFTRAEYNSTSSDTNIITVSLNRDTSVKAYYQLITQTLTININNPALGKVQISYPNFQEECTTPPCQYTVPKNAQITLLAMPSPGYTFDYWQRDNYPPEKENPITFTMDTDYTVTAYFTELIYAEIRGVVRGILGRPVAGAIISLDTVTRTKSKEDGTYLLQNIPNNTYILTAEHWLYEKLELPIEIKEPKTYYIDLNLTFKRSITAAIAGIFSGFTLALLFKRRR